MQIPHKQGTPSAHAAQCLRYFRGVSKYFTRSIFNNLSPTRRGHPAYMQSSPQSPQKGQMDSQTPARSNGLGYDASSAAAKRLQHLLQQSKCCMSHTIWANNLCTTVRLVWECQCCVIDLPASISSITHSISPRILAHRTSLLVAPVPVLRHLPTTNETLQRGAHTSTHVCMSTYHTPDLQWPYRDCTALQRQYIVWTVLP